MTLEDLVANAGALISVGGINKEYDNALAQLLVSTGALQELVSGDNNELLIVLIRGYALAMRERRALGQLGWEL